MLIIIGVAIGCIVTLFMVLGTPAMVEIIDPLLGNDYNDMACHNGNYPRDLDPTREECESRNFCDDKNPVVRQNCDCCYAKYRIKSTAP